MSVSSQIARLSDAKNEIVSAIKKYGVTVPSDADLENLADKCLAIASIVTVIVDSALLPTSKNAVENRVVYRAQHWQYHATFPVDGWVDCSDDEKSSGYLYKQTVSITPADDSAPQVTSESEFCDIGTYEPTGIPSTDAMLACAANIVDTGYTVSEDGGKVTTLVSAKPACDITISWKLKT